MELKLPAKEDKKYLRGLGVFYDEKFIYLLFQSPKDKKQEFRIAKSSDGFEFEIFKKNCKIKRNSDYEDISTTYDYELFKESKKINLLYKRSLGKSWAYVISQGSNISSFSAKKMLPWMGVTGSIVRDFKYEGKYVMYVGGNSIKIAYSENLEKWDFSEKDLISPRENNFDNEPIEIEYATLTEKGILIIYYSAKKSGESNIYKIGAALLDKNEPTKILWRANDALWDTSLVWKGKVELFGTIMHEDEIISYWNVAGEGIFAVLYSLFKTGDGLQTRNVSLKLDKHSNNPILKPNDKNSWETFNTFNPAAFYEDGKVHLLYRAQGYDYVSVIGYATSNDGINIDRRYDEPVYTPRETFEYFDKKQHKINKKYISGGGYGGSEDPRITKIEDKLYMTYVAFDGYNPPRVALTSINLDDFLNQRWIWETPVLISPPNVVDKNACIFPEKIRGKYVILHRIYPDILIDYVDDLNFDGTKWLEGKYKISPRKDKWDSRKIGAGPPPIKTKEGWLLIYQAVGNQDAGRYKIGAMLLDLENPEKVLYRSDAPILEPREVYENEGFKSGVTYPCGAVVINNVIHVYYGAADSYVCVATANLDEFISELKHSEIANLNNPIIQKIL